MGSRIRALLVIVCLALIGAAMIVAVSRPAPVLPIAAPAGAPKPLGLELQLAFLEIREFDPLLLKVTFVNNTTQPRLLMVPRSIKGWSTELQVYSHQTSKTQQLHAAGSYDYAHHCVLRGNAIAPTIEPGQRFITYEWLQWHDLFSEEFGSKNGSWTSLLPAPPLSFDIRASILLNGEVLRSEIVTVRVRPASERVRSQIEELGHPSPSPQRNRNSALTLARDPLPSHYNNVVSRRLTESEALPAGSYLRLSLEWKRAVADLVRSETAIERTAAQARLDATRAQLDPVTNEAIDLVLAWEYHKVNRWDEVLRSLGKVPQRSYWSESLRNEAKGRLYESLSRITP